MIIDYTEILQSAEFVIFLRISYRLSLVCPLELTMILSSEWPYQQGDHLGRAKISWRLAALIFLLKLKVIQQVKKYCGRLYNIQTVQIRQNKEQRYKSMKFSKKGK